MTTLESDTAEGRRIAVPPCPPVDADAFRDGMRRLGAAVCVVAVCQGEERAGLTATAVCSVSVTPPRLLVCVNSDVRAHALIADGGALSVNVLAREQVETARRFAGMVPGVTGGDRFESGKWHSGADGRAIVLSDAAVSFECTVADILESGSHSVFICDVVDVRSADAASEPLLYFSGDFRTLSAAAVG